MYDEDCIKKDKCITEQISAVRDLYLSSKPSCSFHVPHD